MADKDDDAGVIQVLLEDFETHRMPRARDIQKRVEAGEPLSSNDVDFLEETMRRAQQVVPLVERNPEYQELAVRAIHLYKAITDRALQNEKSKK